MTTEEHLAHIKLNIKSVDIDERLKIAYDLTWNEIKAISTCEDQVSAFILAFQLGMARGYCAAEVENEYWEDHCKRNDR